MPRIARPRGWHEARRLITPQVNHSRQEAERILAFGTQAVSEAIPSRAERPRRLAAVRALGNILNITESREVQTDDDDDDDDNNEDEGVGNVNIQVTDDDASVATIVDNHITMTIVPPVTMMNDFRPEVLNPPTNIVRVGHMEEVIATL